MRNGPRTCAATVDSMPTALSIEDRSRAAQPSRYIDAAYFVTLIVIPGFSLFQSWSPRRPSRLGLEMWRSASRETFPTTEAQR